MDGQAYVTVNIDQLVRLRRALRICRIVTVALLGLAPVNPAIVWTAGLGLVFGVANLSMRRLRRALLAGELMAGCGCCISVTWAGFVRLDARSLFTPEEAPAWLLFHGGVAWWLIYRLRRFMYPASTDPLAFEHVTELLHGDLERKKAAIIQGRGRAILDVFLLIAWVRFSVSTWSSTAFGLLLFWLAVAYAAVTIAAALLSLTDVALLVQRLRGPRGRVRRSYVWYLIAHGGKRLRAFALFAASISFFTVFLFESASLAIQRLFVVFIVIPLVLWWAAYVCYRSATQALARGLTDAEAARVETAGDFSLYLRSFADDVIELDFAGRGWRRLMTVPFSFLPGQAARTFRLIRVEEFLSRAMWPYRPLLAVAPSVDAKVMGALQVRLAESEWRDRVVQLAQRAASILLVAGDSPGLRWEVQQLTADVETRRKVLLLFPPVDDAYLPRRYGSLGMRVPDALKARTIAIRFLAGGGVQLMVADSPSPAAYRMALRVAEHEWITASREQEVSRPPGH